MDEVVDVARASDEDASESDDGSECSLPSYSELNWYVMSDSILLSIFQYLTPKELTTAGEVCRSWYRVSRDEFLWKYLFYRTYKIDPDVGIVPGTYTRRIDAIVVFVTRSKITFPVRILHVGNVNLYHSLADKVEFKLEAEIQFNRITILHMAL